MLGSAVRRSLALAALVALAATGADAAPTRRPAPQVVDPAGDWPVPPMDILDSSIALADWKSPEALEFRIRLAAPPAPVPVTYAVGFSVDCVRWRMAILWPGAGTPAARLDRTDCGLTDLPVDVPEAVTSARFEGREVVMVLHNAPAFGLVPGTTLDAIISMAAEAQAVVFVIDPNSGQRDVAPGDMGWGREKYVVGSERPCGLSCEEE